MPTAHHLEPADLAAYYPPPPRRHRAPFYLGILAAVLAGFALVGFLLSHSTAEPQTPTVATEMPRTIQPSAPAQTPPATQPAAVQPATGDPYAAWLATKPAGAPDLSRDDAMARAMLGCGVTWPAGTTDAALQAAYGPTMCKG